MSKEIKIFNINDMQYKVVAISIQGDKEKNNGVVILLSESLYCLYTH